jgi:hypothetical protein
MYWLHDQQHSTASIDLTLFPQTITVRPIQLQRKPCFNPTSKGACVRRVIQGVQRDKTIWFLKHCSRVFINVKNVGSISNSTDIDCHVDDFLFNTRSIRFITLFQHEGLVLQACC